MALILCIETATNLCSVALALDGEIIICLESIKHNSHSSLVTKYIKNLLNEGGYELADLNSVAIGGGPGSYTGIRIGMAISKGLCYGLDIPLIKIGTLKGMANGARKQLELEELDSENILLIPMLDARRKEIFTAIYDSNLNEIEKPHPEIIDDESIAFERFIGKRLVYFGNGADKCDEYLGHHNKKIKLVMSCSAQNFAELAEKQFKNDETENLALTSASYYKEFYTK